MAIIALDKDKFAIVDDEDLSRISLHKWRAYLNCRVWYSCRSVREGTTVRSIAMHREILRLTNPAIKVDHKDGNGLNNTKINLRICNESQNQGNRKKHWISASRFKGVSPCPNGKWMARIRKNGKMVYLGSFVLEKDAACAYDRAALAHFGEFARINFPDCGQEGCL